MWAFGPIFVIKELKAHARELFCNHIMKVEENFKRLKSWPVCTPPVNPVKEDWQAPRARVAGPGRGESSPSLSLT
jgi:hypothetical protein